MRRPSCFCLMMLLAIAGCGGDDPAAPSAADRAAMAHAKAVEPADALAAAPAAVSRLSVATRQTWKSAHRVARAADEFARDNGGLYPGFLADTNAAGWMLIDRLPGHRLLRNAFTGLRTEPADGAAAYVGQVAYEPIHWNGYSVGYVVTAMGATPDEVLRIERLPD